MNRKILSCIAIIAGTCLAPIPSVSAADEKGDVNKLVYRVTDAKARVIDSAPKQIQLIARGEVRTGGWTNIHLRAGGSRPSDGIYDFRFVGRKPDGPATQVITPVKAELTIPKPEGFKGARVIAETNSTEAR